MIGGEKNLGSARTVAALCERWSQSVRRSLAGVAAPGYSYYFSGIGLAASARIFATRASIVQAHLKRIRRSNAPKRGSDRMESNLGSTVIQGTLPPRDS